MIVKYLGKKLVNFTSEKGEVISGISLHCYFQDESFDGFRAEKFFIKNGIDLPECKPNDPLDLSFNMHGKVEKITKA